MYLIDEKVGSDPNLKESGGDYERHKTTVTVEHLYISLVFFQLLGGIDHLVESFYNVFSLLVMWFIWCPGTAEVLI